MSRRGLNRLSAPRKRSAGRIRHAVPGPAAIATAKNFEGTGQGTPLAGVDFRHGDSVEALSRSIASGFPDAGMRAWSETLDAHAIQRLAIYVAEQCAALQYTDFRVAAAPAIPDGVITSEAEAFRVEISAEGLDPLPCRPCRIRAR